MRFAGVLAPITSFVASVSRFGTCYPTAGGIQHPPSARKATCTVSGQRALHALGGHGSRGSLLSARGLLSCPLAQVRQQDAGRSSELDDAGECRIDPVKSIEVRSTEAQECRSLGNRNRDDLDYEAGAMNMARLRNVGEGYGDDVTTRV